MERLRVFIAAGIITVSSLLVKAQGGYSEQNTGYNTTTTGSTQGFGKGTNVIGVGLGLGGTYSYNSSGYSSSPNIIASYDNGTFGNVGPGTISLGALVSFKTIHYNYAPYYYYNQRWNYWIMGFRSAYHVNFIHSSHFDPYIGLMLGYYYVNYLFSSNAPDYKIPGSPYYYPPYTSTYSSYWALSGYLGLRYYIYKNIGLWLEAGVGYTNLAYGVNIRF